MCRRAHYPGEIAPVHGLAASGVSILICGGATIALEGGAKAIHVARSAAATATRMSSRCLRWLLLLTSIGSRTCVSFPKSSAMVGGLVAFMIESPIRRLSPPAIDVPRVESSVCTSELESGDSPYLSLSISLYFTARTRRQLRCADEACPAYVERPHDECSARIMWRHMCYAT